MPAEDTEIFSVAAPLQDVLWKRMSLGVKQTSVLFWVYYLLFVCKLTNFCKLHFPLLQRWEPLPGLFRVCTGYKIISDILHPDNILPYHVTSHHITSYIMSYTSYHVLSYHIHVIHHIISISHNIYYTSCPVISHHIMSYHIMSYHIVSYHTSHHILSHHIIYCIIGTHRFQ